MKKIEELVRKYAQSNGIEVLSTPYQTYSMLKHETLNFPQNNLFLSFNLRGKKGNKDITIIAKDEHTISAFETEQVLERSPKIDNEIDQILLKNRYRLAMQRSLCE